MVANSRRCAKWVSAGLVVQGARRAGLVNADGLRPTLEAAGWEIIAGRTGELSELDLLVVRDVAVTEFEDRGESVRKYVEAGGGLLVAGGTRCFGPGGWGGTPLEACLPVLSHPGDDGLFVAVLLDRSGTMAEPLPESPAPPGATADSPVIVLLTGIRLPPRRVAHFVAVIKKIAATINAYASISVRDSRASDTSR